MLTRSHIELLAPAGTLAHGIEAIKYGADAVYIGGPSFSARAAVANSIDDIHRLADFAHLYNAKVYVALNTILIEDEVRRAQELAFALYDAGADALIIQDYALLSIDMPPIPLHASTQMNNRTQQKVAFLQQCGFEQVVLARESDIQTIRTIASATSVRLETFVHGALCVSYSGQCYLSERMTGRSANRGECAQPCRLPYSLVDADGKTIVRNSHLLSLKDFSAEQYLADLLDAGVSAFKIEGRLKDINYVRNNTLYYRRKLDELLATRPHLVRASFGNTNSSITPDPHKSFNRSFCSLRLSGERSDIASPLTPKSLGEYIGRAGQTTDRTLAVKSRTPLTNGDGFCYIDANGLLQGFRADTASAGRITLPQGVSIPFNTPLYRSYDKAFEDALDRDKCERKLSVNICVEEAQDGFRFTATALPTNISFTIDHTAPKTPASNPTQAHSALENALRKTGGTPFTVANISIDFPTAYFMPASQINAIRRDLFAGLAECISASYRRELPLSPSSPHPQYPADEPKDYRLNVHNPIARRFLSLCGATPTAPSYETTHTPNAELMRTHHCIRYFLGLCPKHPQPNAPHYRLPLTLVSNRGHRFALNFDCKHCEMTVLG